jgi:type I restriction enzyme S subunit
MPALDIDPHDLATVRAILHQHIPEFEVRAFGSRIKQKARRTSDLDLAVMTDRPLEVERLADLREAFSESDLPFMVDLVDWAVTDERFRRIIEGDWTMIAPGKG